MGNDSLNKIGQVLLNAENVLLFPHTNADGDAAGSCVALCHGLRKSGIKCYILIEDKFPDNLDFLDYDGEERYTTYDGEIFGQEPDVCVMVDNGEVERLPKRKETFLRGKTKVCIDHHPTSKPFADYNYIEPGAAAVGEIIYELLEAMNVKMDEEIGGALFSAITTDCGNFQYSNTTKKTFEIMVKLMDLGFNLSEISNTIYQNNPIERIKLETEILNTLELCGDNHVAIAYATQEMLRKCNARMEHTEGVINTLRGIAGVEVAVFLKENAEAASGSPAVVKVSMRSKSYANVSELCQRFGGGGHVRASGCTLNMSIGEAMELMKKEVPGIL